MALFNLTKYTLSLPSTREPSFDSSLADRPLMGYPVLGESLDHIPTPFGGKLVWVGNATCVIELNGIRFMTDLNFLHQGDHVHLGPGITTERIKEPAFDYLNCPTVDFVRSHLHGDHFDQLVAEKLRKDLPIISNPYACDGLKKQGHAALSPLQTWETIQIVKEGLAGDEFIITSMPGRHALLPLAVEELDDITGIYLIPPVMGSMITFKAPNTTGKAKEYNLYISGDTYSLL